MSAQTPAGPAPASPERRQIIAALALLPAAAHAAPAHPARAAPPVARLSLNENPFGPSPHVLRAIAGEVRQAHRYADDAQARALIDQIARKEQVAPDQVVLGEILEALGLYLAAQAPAGGRFVYSDPGYTALVDAARPLGGVGVAVPLDREGRNDLPALTRAIAADTRALYLVNPHNPSGTVNDRQAFDDFLSAAARRTLVIVDEAYLDYDDLDARSAARFTRAGANIAVFRTLAKIYGLAGLPIGYTIAPLPLARALRASGLGDPHAQGRLALAAASAALADQAWIRQVRERTLAGRARLTAALDRLGLPHSQSHANFVFFRSPIDAANLRARLHAAGIDVARAFPPLDAWVRITVGTETQVTRTIQALDAILA
jgi:histidinol-phosphate aminotransferase